MLKKHKTFRIIIVVSFAVLIAAFFLYQVFTAARNPVKTQTAFAADIYKTADTRIYAIRRETPVSISSMGFVVPMVNNCDRVACGETIAASFADETAAQAYSTYLELQDEIRYYNKLSESTVSQYTDLDKLITEADNSVFRFASAVYTGDLTAAREAAVNIRSKITMRQNASGEKVDYTGILASLNSQSAQCLANAGQYTAVCAPSAGYYTSVVDGYENMIPFDNAENMTVGDIEKALHSAPVIHDTQSGGKLIIGFDWYFVCNIDITHMSDIRVGQKKTVILPYSSADNFTAEVYKINDTKDGKTAVVFRVKQLNADLAALRTEYASIVLDSFSGYKIPNTAIRVIDGVKGVYILRNNLVSFKKIDIFYSDDEYSIVGNAESKDGYIRLYDEVITEGTDLYDGKLVG